jgi:hypothetical protein
LLPFADSTLPRAAIGWMESFITHRDMPDFSGEAGSSSKQKGLEGKSPDRCFTRLTAFGDSVAGGGRSRLRGHFDFSGTLDCTLCEYVVTMTTRMRLLVGCPAGTVGLSVGAFVAANKNGPEKE